jgi:hypothetical protein
MAWLCVDRSLVVQRVCPALRGRDDVVNNGGTRLLADVADRVVSVEDVLRITLLLPTRAGVLPALRGGEGLGSVDRAGLVVRALRVSAELATDLDWHG